MMDTRQPLFLTQSRLGILHLMQLCNFSPLSALARTLINSNIYSKKVCCGRDYWPPRDSGGGVIVVGAGVPRAGCGGVPVTGIS